MYNDVLSVLSSSALLSHSEVFYSQKQHCHWKEIPIFFMGHYLSTTNQMKSLLRFEMYYVFQRHYCNGHWTSLVYDHIRFYPSTNLSIFLMVTYTTYTIHLASKKIDNRETISCIIICLNGIRSTA